jgi:hypothetical protein
MQVERSYMIILKLRRCLVFLVFRIGLIGVGQYLHQLAQKLCANSFVAEWFELVCQPRRLRRQASSHRFLCFRSTHRQSDNGRRSFILRRVKPVAGTSRG